MNDDDLRDLFAGFALMGMLASGRKNVEYEAYKAADVMIETKYAELDEGIAAVAPKKRRSRVSE